MQMSHQRLSLRHIAAVLRRAPSSISCEIRRNTIAVATVPYDAAAAGRRQAVFQRADEVGLESVAYSEEPAYPLTDPSGEGLTSFLLRHIQ